MTLAWRKRMGETMLLAGYLYDYQAPQAAGTRLEVPSRAVYQKALILDAARLHGWRVASRRELNPEQLGQICTDLRGMIEALGLSGPEHARDERARETKEPTTRDWKQFTKVYSDLLASGWSDKRFHAWLMKFHRRHTVRGMPARQLRAVIRGIEGILKHSKGTCGDRRVLR